MKISHLILAVIYPFLITFSFYGWGCLVVRALQQERIKIGIGITTTLGLASVMVIGGWLNLFQLISCGFLHSLMGIGLFLAVIDIINNTDQIKVYAKTWSQCCKNNGLLSCLIAINLLLFMFVFLETVSVGEQGFNQHDDLQAYFVFPAKMLQTGALGNDPFSERRIVTSLGGKYFLDTFTLLGLGPSGFHIMDRNVGLLILLALLIESLSFFNSGVLFRQFAVMTVIISPPPTINITGLVLGVAVFWALLLYSRRIAAGPEPSTREAVVLGLLLSSAAMLKTSLIPPAALLGLSIIFLLWAKTSKRILKLLVIAFSVVILILPWMVAMYQSSGTFLCPFLGKGFHGSAYGYYLQGYSELNARNLINFVYEIFNPLCFVFLFISLVYVVLRKSSFTGALMALSILSGMLLITFATAGYGVYRYSFSFIYPFVIISIIDIAHSRSDMRFAGESLKKLGYLLLAVLLGAGMSKVTSSSKVSIYNLANSQRIFETKDQINEAQKYAELQRTIPVGAIILERLEKPYLLDFRRNMVYVNDYPGGSSLPEGIPFREGSEALAQYLLDHSIRYIAYSYKNEAKFTMEEYGHRLAPNMNAWIRSEAEHTFDFQNNVATLGRTRKIIFDDGHNFVLDLKEALKKTE